MSVSSPSILVSRLPPFLSAVMLTVKQVRGIALVLCFLAAVLSIASLSMPKIASGGVYGSVLAGELTFLNPNLTGNGTATGSASISIGAFQVCFEAALELPVANEPSFTLSASSCSFIDSQCRIGIGGYIVPPPNAADWKLTGYSDMCKHFNVFRSLIVVAVLLLCAGLVCGLVYVTVDASQTAKCALRAEVVFSVLQSLAVVCFVGALVAANAVITGVPNFEVSQGSYFSVTLWSGKSTSYLLVSASTACLLLTVVVWVVGKFVGSKEQTSETDVPLIVESIAVPAAAISDHFVQLPQPAAAEGAAEGQQQQQQQQANAHYGLPQAQFGMLQQHPASRMQADVRYGYHQRYRYQPIDDKRYQLLDDRSQLPK